MIANHNLRDESYCGISMYIPSACNQAHNLNASDVPYRYFDVGLANGHTIFHKSKPECRITFFQTFELIGPIINTSHINDIFWRVDILCDLGHR
jgi:hypothetical protein